MLGGPRIIEGVGTDTDIKTSDSDIRKSENVSIYLFKDFVLSAEFETVETFCIF